MPDARLTRTREAYREHPAFDAATGISVRFIRQYDPSMDRDPRSFGVWMPKHMAERYAQLPDSAVINDDPKTKGW